ncbi:MAG: pyridoxal phosphate-dependent aminotransferase [Deltaproteobacteria bacterium]|nr:pyridoxal phosphate-dependent aminotransferase [Deltaproteobacteria bacterium]
MSTGLANRAGWIKPSATLELVAKVRALLAQGRPVVRFDAGEPDFSTPGRIVRAAEKAMEDGKTGYTAASGIVELKDAICRVMDREYGIDVSIGNVIVSSGAKQSLFNAVSMLFQEGDEVILLSPFWVSYPAMVGFNGAKVVVVSDPAGGLLPRLEQVERSITSSTRGIILNNPNNPSGVVMSHEYMEGLSRLVMEHDLWAISDEIYSKLVFEKAFKSFVSLDPRLKERTITINGVSKTYAMTGWRIGFAIGPEEVISRMAALQSQSTSNPCTISQWAAVEALTGPQDDVREMTNEFKARRNELVELLNRLPGIRCPMPDGAFYALPDFSAYLEREIDGTKISSDQDLAAYFLESYMVAVVPGSAFGADGRLRFSYTCDREKIKEGVARISAALERLGYA